MAKVLIGFPCHGDPKRGFMFDYVNLLAYTGKGREDGECLEIQCGNTVDSILPRGRQGLVQYAIEKDCTHLLTLDADMRFPPDTLFRLFDHKLPFVGANYVGRRSPFAPTACKGGKLVTSQRRTGVETGFDYFGLGVTLIDVKVFHDLWADEPDMPHFMIGWSKSEKGWIGEDVYFMRRVRALGYDLAIDHDLSNEVSHIGEMEYNFHVVDHDEKDFDPRVIAGGIDESWTGPQMVPEEPARLPVPQAAE